MRACWEGKVEGWPGQPARSTPRRSGASPPRPGAEGRVWPGAFGFLGRDRRHGMRTRALDRPLPAPSRASRPATGEVRCARRLATRCAAPAESLQCAANPASPRSPRVVLPLLQLRRKEPLQDPKAHQSRRRLRAESTSWTDVGVRLREGDRRGRLFRLWPGAPLRTAPGPRPTVDVGQMEPDLTRVSASS